MATHESSSGGFILSPPPSSIASSIASGRSALPQPRDSPLRAGGSKESTLIRHLDSKILHVQRRFARRTTFSLNALNDGAQLQAANLWPGDIKGYANMKEACKEIEELVDVVWVSGTPSLQVPYLISLALLLSTTISGMPPSPRRLFRLIGKLDRAFASLLQGRDVETGEALPGFQSRRGISGTEKVRIRSLVERTRISVMEAFKRGEFDLDDVEDDDDNEGDQMDVDMEGELVLEGDDFDVDEDENWDMSLARVYDQTIVELGDSLAEPSIGIITEGRG